ncbi:MAG TPA: lysylphosphatidylglycerol synthase domain-containing protein [Gemmatimonadales bacterium]|nr:lysylphosphatidylglycerol synthase domain-containing protein [Gemmatimonadales bacterium]
MSSVLTRQRIWVAAQVLFMALALWFAGRALSSQWRGVRVALAGTRPTWSLVALSVLLVLLDYALLIRVWQAMLRTWGEGGKLSFREAARIWFVSNLGRYIPGKVWQIATMAVMAQRRGVSPVTATGASLVVNLANVASGFVVVLATGAAVFRSFNDARPHIGLLVAVILGAGLLLLPLGFHFATPIVARLTRDRIRLPAIPARAIWLAALGTAAAWVVYGLAFQWFTTALVHRVTGGTALYVAAFTGSYLVGYLAVVAPGGIVVREYMLATSLTSLGLLAGPDAWLVAIASRLWLTAVEVAPGLLSLLIPGERS